MNGRKPGGGRKVDVAMLDGQLAILEHAIAITNETGHPPGCVWLWGWTHCPRIAARNMVVELANPKGGKPYLAAGNPIKISDMDDTLPDARAPTLDGDRAAVLKWLDAG